MYFQIKENILTEAKTGNVKYLIGVCSRPGEETDGQTQ
jgi:hypothetical protein